MRPLPGTEGARHPFWSADSRQVAFFADGRLKALALGGGEPRAIAEAPFGQAGTWGEDGVILFPLPAHGGLHRVRMEGGTAVRVTEPDIAQGQRHQRPSSLTTFTGDHEPRERRRINRRSGDQEIKR